MTCWTSTCLASFLIPHPFDCFKSPCFHPLCALLPCQEDSDDDSSSFLSERRLPDMSKGAFLCSCFSWAVAAIFPGLVYFRVCTDRYKDLYIYIKIMYICICICKYVCIYIYIYTYHGEYQNPVADSLPTDQYEGWVPSEFPGRFVLFPGPIRQGPPQIKLPRRVSQSAWHGRHKIQIEMTNDKALRIACFSCFDFKIITLYLFDFPALTGIS